MLTRYIIQIIYDYDCFIVYKVKYVTMIYLNIVTRKLKIVEIEGGK